MRRCMHDGVMTDDFFPLKILIVSETASELLGLALP
jgi:hypothetical protein